jgi:hypothetical protein
MPDSAPSENRLGAAGRNRSGSVGDVPDDIGRRYFTDDRGGPGRGYYVDASVGRAAFRDRGDYLTAERADPNAIRDMSAIARHRGWQIVTVKGSTEFRREAWLAGRQAGLEVYGYQPSERDLQELLRRRERQERGNLRAMLHEDRDEDRRERANGLREETRSRREDRRGAAQMRVVEAVVRDRVEDPGARGKILAAARDRIADWLERGAVFEPARAQRNREPENRESGAEVQSTRERSRAR